MTESKRDRMADELIEMHDTACESAPEEVEPLSLLSARLVTERLLAARKLVEMKIEEGLGGNSDDWEEFGLEDDALLKALTVEGFPNFYSDFVYPGHKYGTVRDEEGCREVLGDDAYNALKALADSIEACPLWGLQM